jgi:hypothetical protein
MIIFQPWSKIKSYVHYKPIAAGYPDIIMLLNGSVMTYGDGSGTGGFDILTALGRSWSRDWSRRL